MTSTKRYMLYGLFGSGNRNFKARIGAIVRRKDVDGFDVYFDALPIGDRGTAVPAEDSSSEDKEQA